MIEKLRIFFIKAQEWTNPRVYRSTVVREGLEHFLGIQMPVTHELTGEQQHRNLMAVAGAGGCVRVHVEHVKRIASGGWKPIERGTHLLA
jgi:hypothetical protein